MTALRWLLLSLPIVAACAMSKTKPDIGNSPRDVQRSEAEPEVPSWQVASVAVLPIRPKGQADPSVIEVLDDLVLSTLHGLAKGRLRVVGKSDIDALLGFEQSKDALGCDEVACAAELAGALGVESIISINAGTLGGRYILTMAWIHQQQVRALGRHSENLGSAQHTFDVGVRKAVAGLLGMEAPPTEDAGTPTHDLPPSSDRYVTVFEDDFTDNRHNWWTGESEYARVWIKGGSYYFQYTGESGNWMVYRRVDLNDRDDFIIEADIARIAGPDNYGFGVDWGIRDGKHHHSFLLFNQGLYQYWFKDAGDHTSVLPHSRSRHVKTGDAVNRVAIHKIGERYEFYVNGEYVAQAKATPFWGNRIGFHLWQPGILRVDRLVVRQARR